MFSTGRIDCDLIIIVSMSRRHSNHNLDGKAKQNKGSLKCLVLTP